MSTTRGGVLLLGILLASCCAAAGLSSCCTGISGDDLAFIGEVPTNITGTGADNAAVLAALDELMTGRIYDTGMYMQWTCRKSNKSKLQVGEVLSYGAGAGTATGTGRGEGPYYIIELPLPEGPRLTVKFVYDHAQHLIYEVRLRHLPQLSPTARPAECTLTGTLAGETVDLAFQQQIRGKRLDTFRLATY